MRPVIGSVATPSVLRLKAPAYHGRYKNPSLPFPAPPLFFSASSFSHSLYFPPEPPLRCHRSAHPPPPPNPSPTHGHPLTPEPPFLVNIDQSPREYYCPIPSWASAKVVEEPTRLPCLIASPCPWRRASLVITPTSYRRRGRPRRGETAPEPGLGGEPALFRRT